MDGRLHRAVPDVLCCYVPSFMNWSNLVRLVALYFVHLAIDNQQTRPQALRHTIHLAAPGPSSTRYPLRDGSSPPVSKPSSIQRDHYYSHHVPLDVHLLVMQRQTTFPDRGPGLQQPGICAPSCRLSINSRHRTGLKEDIAVPIRPLYPQ